MVAKLWQEAFGIEMVGIEDNFFDLAGNSLLALQIVTRLRKAFHVDLPMTSLFEAPTVAGLAQVIEELGLKDSQPHNMNDSEFEDLSQIISEIEGLSHEEAEKRLAEEMESNE
jgi:acyl carrier protein